MSGPLTAGNLFDALAPKSADEQVDALVEQGGVTIERIVSMGHASPPGFWYDSPRAE
jgi:cupin 2 domain-containing protein